MLIFTLSKLILYVYYNINIMKRFSNGMTAPLMFFTNRQQTFQIHQSEHHTAPGPAATLLNSAQCPHGHENNAEITSTKTACSRLLTCQHPLFFTR